MAAVSRFAVPLAELDAVEVPVEEQVEQADVRRPHDDVAPEDLDRARLLSITEAGRLRLR